MCKIILYVFLQHITYITAIWVFVWFKFGVATINFIKKYKNLLIKNDFNAKFFTDAHI